MSPSLNERELKEQPETKQQMLYGLSRESAGLLPLILAPLQEEGNQHQLENSSRTCCMTPSKGESLYNGEESMRKMQDRPIHKQKADTTILTLSGLVIYAEHGWLACSPLDLVQDSSVEPENQQGLVEYKCPYSARDITVEEGCKNKGFMSTMQNNQVVLKRTHKYYYQVQGQMMICGKRWCDFVIWTPSSLSIERITFDPQFWQDTQAKLEHFYDQAVLPELASPRFPQGQPIREPKKNSAPPQ